ncbi:MAG TPA: choice-of-anchor tandem repeat GloVer-containing protein [Bacteroidia bacterium]|jgi:uncharacterized repeat protein (TIGR03803 family)|nr:choice-of-anchor tandem repeat GloVer-containing protein [Bacteroidia bacterium]
MKKNYLLCIGLLGLAITTLQAQSYTLLKALGGVQITGKYPQRNLVILGKHLYGMTSAGGTYNYGTLFTVDTNGNGFKRIVDFDPATNGGAGPSGSLTLVGNKLFGMTYASGGPGGGLIFSVDTDGTNFTTLHGFGSGSDGSKPRESLTLVGNTLFGTCEQGGTFGYGTIFSISTGGGSYKVLLNFNDTNGMEPICNLVPVGKRLYGTAFYGGAGGSFNGCIYSIDISGTNDTVIHTFDNTNGANPFGSVTIAGNTIFGTTEFGGSSSKGVIYSLKTDGSGFKLLSNSGGQYTGDPIISGGALYEMSAVGGISGDGVVFSLDTNGSNYNQIISFSGNTGTYPGALPYGGLLNAGGTFYGMTMNGGVNDSGVVFKLRPGPTAVNEISSSKSDNVLIYPNPNDGNFNLVIRNKASNDKNILEVYNLLGKKLFSQNLDNSQITNPVNMSSYVSGIYFYRVLSEKGILIGQGKLVKEN